MKLKTNVARRLIITLLTYLVQTKTDNICLLRPYSNIFQENTKYDKIKINGIWRLTLRLIATIMWATKLLES